MSDRIEHNLMLGILLDHYGALLGDRQREILENYVLDDLSLSEIAENFGITRQGVRDSIKKSEEALAHYEAALGLYAKAKENERQLASLQSKLNALTLSKKEEATRQEIAAMLSSLLS